MQYEKLTDEARAQMLDDRLAQYEAEHYQHEVNVQLLTASGSDDSATTAAINEAKAAQLILDKAHAGVKAEAVKVKSKMKPAKPEK